MNNVWVRWSGLALLDDVASAVYVSRLGEALSRGINHKAAAAPKAPATPAKTNPAPGRAPAIQNNALLGKALATSAAGANKNSSKVFSSTPSLRQLMNEYNRPNSRLAPIKTTPTQPSNGTYEFEFDEVDFIQLAAIPGRVLRPSS